MDFEKKIVIFLNTKIPASDGINILQTDKVSARLFLRGILSLG